MYIGTLIKYFYFDTTHPLLLYLPPIYLPSAEGEYGERSVLTCFAAVHGEGVSLANEGLGQPRPPGDHLTAIRGKPGQSREDPAHRRCLADCLHQHGGALTEGVSSRQPWACGVRGQGSHDLRGAGGRGEGDGHPPVTVALKGLPTM